MQQQDSVFRGLLKLIPWREFDRLVDTHKTDDLVRRFTTKHQLIALLYGQMSGAQSLRDIETTMESHRGRLYHMGGKAPARSTLADANRTRSSQVFSSLLRSRLL